MARVGFAFNNDKTRKLISGVSNMVKGHVSASIDTSPGEGSNDVTLYDNIPFNTAAHYTYTVDEIYLLDGTPIVGTYKDLVRMEFDHDEDGYLVAVAVFESAQAGTVSADVTILELNND